MSTKTIGELSAQEIRGLVRGKYSEVALHPQSGFKFRVGKAYALDIGYPADTMDGPREVMAESFTGVSSFLAHFEDFSAGEVILELGSGAGLDTASLARKVGTDGKVIGLDLSLAMIRKATGALGELDVSQARCCQAQAEDLPLPDSSVDWVVSNGIFNLSPEKERILNEIHRVLKPEGRVLCSEIVLNRDPTPEERDNADDWFK
jgi:SAM-dependent methyltransferase